MGDPSLIDVEATGTKIKERRLNISRYRRLCLVMIIPLLFAGLLLIPDPPYARGTDVQICEGYSGEFSCDGFGKEQLDRRMSHGSSYAEVAVTHNLRSYGLTYDFYTTPIVQDVKIISARLIYYTGQQEQNFVGKRATILLGADQKGRSLLDTEKPTIYCNELTLGKVAKLHEYTCNDATGRLLGWLLTIVDSNETNKILQLRAAIEKEIEHVETIYLQNIAWSFAVPFILYFIFSVFIWMLYRAFHYVRQG